MTSRAGIDYTGIAVVFLCHDGAGNIVMALRGKDTRDEQGRWDIGAGALEHGLTLEEQLKKEIQEEYGTTVINLEYMGYRTIMREYAGEQTHWVGMDFAVHVDAASVHNNEPHKLDEVGWYTLDALPTPLHSQLPFFLNKYQNTLNRLLRPHA